MKDFSNPKNIPYINKTRHDPLPFPGMCPTRWLIKLDWDPLPFARLIKVGRSSARYTRTFLYNGKPVASVARKVISVLNGKACKFTAFEYDRGGVIAHSALPSGNGPVTNLSIHDWLSEIYRFYYPWNTGTYFITPWASQIFNRVRLTFRNKKFVVYSNVSSSGLAGTLRLVEHKAWLEKQNMKLGR